MTEQEFYNRATNSKRDLIQEFLEILQGEDIPYSVIGGVAINAYCEPMLTLDLDCVVIEEEIERLLGSLKERGFKVESHPHTWEITHKNSDVRIQIQRDGRYQEFIDKAELQRVLGYTMKVARKEDVLKGKVLAYQDPERDELKRDKDLLDIKRLVRRYPELEGLLSEEIRRMVKR